jgi:hypothetical protein
LNFNIKHQLIISFFLVVFTGIKEAKPQELTLDFYSQAIQVRNEVNQKLLAKQKPKLDTNSVLFINQFFLEPIEKGNLVNGLTSNNFSSRVKLVEILPRKRRRLAEIFPKLERRGKEVMIETMLLNGDSINQGWNFRGKDPIIGVYGQVEQWDKNDILWMEIIEILVKNEIFILFKIEGSFAFNSVVMKDGRLYFLVGLNEPRLLPFDEHIKNRPYILDRDSAIFYNANYPWPE